MSFERYGCDIFLSDGSIFGNDKGDIYTLKDYEKKYGKDVPFEGYYQVLNRLYKRLTTLKGSNIFHPNYGSNLRRLISKPASDTLKRQIAEEVEITLMADDLVKSVSSVNVTISGNKVLIDASVNLIDKDKFSQFIFPAFVIEG